MNDFKQRLEIEREGLASRLDKLDNFLLSEKVNEIDPVQKSLLNIQSSAMNTYLKCLDERLSRF